MLKGGGDVIKSAVGRNDSGGEVLHFLKFRDIFRRRVGPYCTAGYLLPETTATTTSM